MRKVFKSLAKYSNSKYFYISHCYEIKTTVNKRHKEGWMGKMAIDWAHFADSNVCIVDWSRLAVYDYATASNTHTRLVSNFITEFMFFLYQNGMKIEESAIAGHSLGAWIAGFIGTAYGGRLNAIYGNFFFVVFQQSQYLFHLTL